MGESVHGGREGRERDNGAKRGSVSFAGGVSR